MENHNWRPEYLMESYNFENLKAELLSIFFKYMHDAIFRGIFETPRTFYG